MELIVDLGEQVDLHQIEAVIELLLLGLDILNVVGELAEIEHKVGLEKGVGHSLVALHEFLGVLVHIDFELLGGQLGFLVQHLVYIDLPRHFVQVVVEAEAAVLLRWQVCFLSEQVQRQLVQTRQKRFCF